MTAEESTRVGEWYKGDCVGVTDAVVGYVITAEAGSGREGLEDDRNSKKTKREK